MRSLKKNKRELYFALYLNEVENRDSEGNLTSESTPVYSAPTKLDCNISAAVGEDVVDVFGGFANYTRTITITDTACPMDENSIVWFGVPTTGPHNYIVTKKADSKNGLLYALLEVKVKG